MSRMLSKMNLISAVQQLPKEDIETIQGYVEMIEQENKELNQKYLNAVADYETTMSELQELKKQLENANEQIGYLRRSIERKEERIIELEHERVPYENKYVEELKKQIEEYKHKGLYNTCLPYSTGYKKAIKEKENQQKEFIDYMNKTIEELECDDEDDEEMKGYLIQRIDTFKEILAKYKNIIGE